LLDSAVVKLFESALNGHDNISGLVCLSLVESALTISEDALLHVATFVVTLIQNEFCALQLLFVVALGLHPHEVTASNLGSFGSRASLLEAVFAIDVVNCFVLIVGENVMSFADLGKSQGIDLTVGWVTTRVISGHEGLELRVDLFLGGTARQFQNLVVVFDSDLVGHFN